MRFTLLCLALLCLAVPGAADDPKEDPKRDYAEFSKMIHKMVVKEVPKEFEDSSNWGNIIPLTEKVLFPNLQRTKVRIGNKEGYPDGVWRRYIVRIENPDKDLKINVKEFSKVDPKTFRLVVDSEVAFTGEGQVHNWQKGVALGKVHAQAGAVLGLGLVFDVGVTFDTKKFPPDIIVEPKIKELTLDLKEFNLRKVANPTTNIVIEGELAKSIGDELKDTLKTLIKSQEAEIKNRANEAIAQSLKEGKGNISASALLKIAPPAKDVKAK